MDIQTENAANERANGVTARAGTEIEHERDMAAKALLPSDRLKCLHDAALADAGFAPNVDRLSASGFAASQQRSVKLLQLRQAIDQRPTIRPDSGRAEDAPSPNRLVEAIDRRFARLCEREAVAKLAIQGLRNEDLTGLCQVSQTGRQIHAFAGHRVLVMAGTTRLACDHVAARHTDVNGQPVT